MLTRVICLFVFLCFNSVAEAQLPDFVEMVKENGDAVVNISTTQKKPDSDSAGEPQMPEGLPPQLDELFRHFFEGPGPGLTPREARSLGSGFIISSDGYVLTNHHVVNGADEIVVKLKDRRQLVAELIGSDESSDIALLKLKADHLPVIRIGSSKKLQVGEWVLAIGTPFGFEQSVTAGIVSAKGRSLPNGNYVPFIQTDVAINPGNSGGPLFNMAGEVVGVNSQIYSRSGGYMGLSFAIPIDVAMHVVEQLKTQGHVSRGWLGVQIQDVNRELAESFGMDRPYGALVSKVIPESPAEKAGLQIGDVIIEYNGQEIENSGDLPPMVGMTAIGDEAPLKLIRNGRSQRVKVRIGLLPEEMELEQPKSQQVFDRLGLIVADLTPNQREKLDVPKNGVLIQKVTQGPALDVGMQQGDVILRIQNNVVRDRADFAKIVDQLSVGQSVAVLVQRRGNPMFLALKLDK